MRLAAMAIAAALTSPALAQEAPGSRSDAPELVEQERHQPVFEPGALIERDLGEPEEARDTGEGAVEESSGPSVIVNRPGEGGIEVTPLAPPGSDLDGGEERGAEELLEDDSIGLLPEPDTLPKSPDDPERARPSFKRPPEDARKATPEGIAIPIEPVATLSRKGVRLRELDKMTGRTDTIEIAVGEERQVGRLKIAVESCRSPENNDPHGTFAFLKVWDYRSGDERGEGEPEEAFSGWMFAQSPSLSALDHPRYDLWLISCTISDAVVSSGSE